MSTAKPLGWVVEVTPAAPGPKLRYNVAEPDKAHAVDAVRRRVREASGASVEATESLSTHDVYGTLRMKRGEVALAE